MLVAAELSCIMVAARVVALNAQAVLNKLMAFKVTLVILNIVMAFEVLLRCLGLLHML